MKRIVLISTTLLAASLLAMPAPRAGLLNLVSGTVNGITGLLDPLFRSLRSFTGSETIKYSLHYQLTGNRIATGPDSATFRFRGPLTVATVNAADADWQATSVQVGKILAWDVSFRIQPGAAQPPVNTDTQVTASYLRMQVGNSVLKELLNNPLTPLPETHVPFSGRMLFELGPVGTADAIRPWHYRATGCLGLESASLFGDLAGKRGALCTSGTFHFPVPPLTIADLQSATTLGAESNVTLVMH